LPILDGLVLVKTANKRVLRAMLKKILKVVAGTCLIILACGCNVDAPRPRMGTLPTPPPGPRFCDPDNLGSHSYHFHPFEQNCIAYTCKAGHIDITHVRWNADYTKYLVEKTRETLMKKDKGFSFNITWELSKHKITFSYPENWDELSQKEKQKIANEIAFEVGPYVTFNATVWHEIITWFGTRFAGFEPEFNSSFSWEDVYSNLLGTKLGIEALKDTEHEYNTAMTLAIDRKLKELGVQPRSTAIEAVEKMRGTWFRGTLLVDTMRKNMDIGLDDGYVTPVLVPGICEEAVPYPLAAPTIDILSKYGFSMKHEIYPREWERHKIFKVVYQDGKGDKIEPRKHFPVIMAHIKKQAVEKYAYIVD
jgi:hypothetical protein